MNTFKVNIPVGPSWSDEDAKKIGPPIKVNSQVNGERSLKVK